ncbi:Dps family protein [Fodinibius saliphilus]|uniref:Dps family protein n=1 Tax=Fodinibius saliphilus TaxID=1920650 RepID=UPI001109D4F5|nr:DNA starvation/stationary phase protection protein [Fodinibius saliphilus]
MNIGIENQKREAVAENLQQLLADEMLIYVKTRNYHWNIEAINFSELHSFYEEQYIELEQIIDEVAERIRMLGHMSIGTMKDFLSYTHLSEQEYTTDAQEQLNQLINDQEAIIRFLRKCGRIFDEEYDDLGSSDFVIALMEQHEKMRWMLASHQA